MLIDEQFRKCVTFLFANVLDKDTGKNKTVPAATAFIVSVPIDDVGVIPYLVTARHVIEASRPYGPLCVRINTTSGKPVYFDAPQDDWVSNPFTDVAVVAIGQHNVSLDFKFLPISMLADDDYVVKHEIGAGDDVFFVGLFSEYAGQQRNQPIIRFGNISLMPNEKIPLRLDPSSDITTPVDAYLVEARSWGGHSGSPAFIYFPPDRKLGSIQVGGSNIALLGLVHGHYEISQDVAFIGDILGSGKVPINAGIAAVIPAQKIVDTLMQEELVEERDKLKKEHKVNNSNT